jgi:NMD protein affecting ribosome stability and mRNA decay
MSTNVMCEECYEARAVITVLLPLGSEMPLCRKCVVLLLAQDARFYVATESE